MKNFGLGFLFIGALILASCGQQTVQTPSSASSVSAQLAEFAQRPELQDAESQAILKEYPDSPELLYSLQFTYGILDESDFAQQLSLNQNDLNAQASGKAGYAQSIAWGSYNNLVKQKAHPSYPELNWIHNGCSVPPFSR